IETQLGVEVSRDAVAVDASAVPEVQGKVAQIEGATTVRAAAEAYEKGDQAGALRIMTDGKQKLAKRKAHLKQEEAALLERDNDKCAGEMQATPAASPAAPAVTKAAKKAAYDAKR